MKKMNRHVIVVFMVFYSLFFFKDIQGFINQGNYRGVNVLTYPYNSVFHDEKRIYKFRKDL